MTSDTTNTTLLQAQEAYVWIWLPQVSQPVVAGRLAKQADGRWAFNYGQSYLARPNAISIYPPELPLTSGAIPLMNHLQIPSCIRDAAPDAWGRRVIINRLMSQNDLGVNSDDIEHNELLFCLASGSDRIGALDFQASPSQYVPRLSQVSTLEELMQSAERVEQGLPLSPALDAALQHGTSIGGARPKALIDDGTKKYIAKFSSTQDVTNVVKAEFIAMRLAKIAGLTVAEVQLTQAMGKDVLLIERFDRNYDTSGWHRQAMVSALTMLQLSEMEARYASYEDLATLIRQRFDAPKLQLEELFKRLVFNILCGNTDDHARNHAAFWDGKHLNLTPAYDICPQPRTGGEATQAMLIKDQQRFSQLTLCMAFAPACMLSKAQANQIIQHQLNIIRANWQNTCDAAGLSEIDRTTLWGRQFLNPYALQGWLE